MKQPTGLDWIVLVLLAIVWGGSFYFIKHSVEIFEPMQMAMWRMVLATLIYVPIAAAYWSKIDWRRWKPLAGVAFFGSAIPNFFFAIAQQHVSSSLAGVLNSLTPIFTFILGMAFFGSKFSLWKFLGILCGLAGATILILSNTQHSVAGSWVFGVLCVLATLCYAINANVVGHYLQDQPPAGIASAAFVLTGGLFVLGLWWSGGWQAAWQHPDGLRGLGYIAYLAAVGTVVASIIYFWLMQRTGPVFATSVTFLLPVAAMLIGFLDGEPVGWMDIAGTGVILTGLWLARK